MAGELVNRPTASVIAVFYRSIPKTIAVLLLWSAPTIIGASILLGCVVYLNARDPDAADYVALTFWLLGGLSLLLAGALLLIACLEGFVRAPHGPIIEVSHTGIRDRRISPDTIPWSGIESMWRVRGTRQLLLILDATAYNRLPQSGLGPWARRRRLKRDLIDRLHYGDNPYDAYTYGYGFGDISISMVDLAGSFETLLRAVERGWGVVGDDSWEGPVRIARPTPE